MPSNSLFSFFIANFIQDKKGFESNCSILQIGTIKQKCELGMQKNILEQKHSEQESSQLKLK